MIQGCRCGCLIAFVTHVVPLRGRICDNTAQDLRFPQPSFPQRQSINCLYAAFRKLSIEKLNSSALMSQRALMHTSIMSLSRQMLLKTWNLVIQFTLAQHTFSWSLGIGLQRWDLHHSGEMFPGVGGVGGGSLSSSSFLAKSKLPLPIANTFFNRYSMSSWLRLAKNSWIENITKPFV